MRLFAVLGWLLAFLAQPAAAATSPELLSLEQQLASLVAGKSGEYGIAALDLHTGKTVSLNGDTAFPMASTVKLAVAAAYLSQVDFGRRTLDQSIGGRRASSLLEAMLIRSDNYATDLLISNLGGPKTVQQWISWHGLSGISIDRTIAQLLSDQRDLRDTRDSSTPLAMIELLKKIETGNVLKPQSRTYLQMLMARCITGSNRIRALLPAGTRVEHKTGTLTGLTDDVGFITLPDGRRIAIAIFARYGSDRPRGIAEAARAIYDGFAATFRYPLVTAYGGR
ncbi:class A beta-lactamase-related serine hydrolase [Sphingomonas sp. RB56-2]|jgi:beta-lactamase class A|uniref:Beta-lactamase n=1 Tax=Sphingomonas brevis TaxID=2908206 RepID=A0ABT0SBB7_9SPHN|nr:serine hydrolase [Sphingomonas brevis]MCL6741720.1 class A beta-lactamase-related serine hydrolase [Sphingomonas brevis]